MIDSYLSQLDWSREPQGLYAPIAYTLESGGKRIRPTLALIACRLFGGKEEDVVPAALALEVFHNFTLLHDDVMDKAAVRRGRPTVHVKWDDNTAILSGDQMMIEAYKLLSQVREDKLPQVLRLFNKMATEICEGQQYDVDFERRDDVSIDDYMMMIRLKTSVLLATALQIGAYIADATETQQQALYNFGIHIGLAFQLQDDILDVYGDPATFGKAIGGDILCNKKTYMLINAINRADSRQRAELMHWINAAEYDPQEKIAAVTDIDNKVGIKQLAEEAIRHYFEESRTHLARVAVDDSRKAVLTQYTDAMMKRQY